MQGQSEVLHPLAEGVHHALRIFLVFEADDEVIGIQADATAVLRAPELSFPQRTSFRWARWWWPADMDASS